jgi:protein-disulfide isomerase
LSSEAPDDTLTIRVRRVHAYLAIGLLVGLALGILLGTTVFERQCPAGLCRLSPSSFSPSAGGGSPTSAAPIKVDVAGRPVQGPANATVTLVEFGDFQCPFCGGFARDSLPTLRRRYAGRIRFVVREFPLTRVHPFALKAAEAAECAFRQGRFFPYYDTLYRHQRALGVPSLKRYAAQTGLARSEFARCVDSGATSAVVRRDMRDGLAYGVSGTPTFFVNGRRIVGNLPLATFEQTLDAALAKPAAG